MTQLPQIINNVIEELRQIGVVPVLVGGMVRDAVMKELNKRFTPSSPDWDIELFLPAETSFAQDVDPLLRKHGYLRGDNVGGRFPVWALMLPDGTKLDFSLPRTEVKTGTTHQDFDVDVLTGTFSPELFKIASQRRDFTCGAMGINLINGELHDPFNGREHLAQNLLVHVNDLSFVEDPLRVWRGIRFCSKLGLLPAESTIEMMRKTADKIVGNISAERITTELVKLLQGGFIARGLLVAAKVLEDTHESFGLSRSVLNKVAVEIGQETPTLFETMLMLLARFSTEQLWQLKFDSQLQNRIKFADKVIKKLMVSPKTDIVREVGLLIGDHMNKLDMSALELLAFIRSITEDLNTSRDVLFALKGVENLIECNRHLPLLNGNDLIKLGFNGAEIGKALVRVREMQIEGLSENEITLKLKSNETK